MRAGGCSVQHTLSAEAAGVVKQAVSLARRRGHAQVTPLHVAITLLMSPTFNMFRKACLQSHSHPLQYKALELCFNVALNRLPTIASSGPVVSNHHGILQGPSLSNALVAAFKRAQANQRRGCLEQQQQHNQNQNQAVMGVKVEMEQLVISILDDPSVSRVMREAGFSSTLLKQNLEDALQSNEIAIAGVVPNQNPFNKSKPCTSSSSSPIPLVQAKPLAWRNPCPPPSSIYPPPPYMGTSSIPTKPQEKDVMAVVNSLVSTRKSRNTVVVGECLGSAEVVVKEVMVRLKADNLPDELKTVEFLNPQLSGVLFRVLDRYQLEERLFDLNQAVVRSVCEGKGAILYLGDLRWALEGINQHENYYPSPNNSYPYPSYYSSCYCPVRHTIMELARMVARYADSRRLWVLASATYQTYLNLQKTQPCLENLWGFHPVTVPAGGLGLSLSMDSSITSTTDNCASPMIDHKGGRCAECSAKAESELQSVCDNTDTEKQTISEILIKWTETCRLQHPATFHYAEDEIQKKAPITVFGIQLSPDSSSTDSIRTHQFFTSDDNEVGMKRNNDSDSDLDACNTHLALYSQGDSPLLLSSDSESFTRLCGSLEQKLRTSCPKIIKEIANTVLMCRSGAKKKRAMRSTWLMLLGFKETVQMNIAEGLGGFFFGSEKKVRRLEMNRNNSLKIELLKAVREDPCSVIVLEDVHRYDTHSITSITQAVRTGVISHMSQNVMLSEAIIILTAKSSQPRKRICRWKRKVDTEPQHDSHLHVNFESKRLCRSSSSSLELDLNTTSGDSSSQRQFLPRDEEEDDNSNCNIHHDFECVDLLEQLVDLTLRFETLEEM